MNYEIAKQLKDAGFPQKPNQNKSIREYIRKFADKDISELDLLNHIHTLIGEDKGLHVFFDFLWSQDYKSTPVSEWEGKTRACFFYTDEWIRSEEAIELTVYVPTLSELIEACKDFKNLEVRKESDVDSIWVAYSVAQKNDLNIPAFIFQTGETPEEAVAKLWLALNKK